MGTRGYLLKLAGIALTTFGLAGCLQVDTCVTLHEDGSATISERVRFSRQLLDLAGGRKEDLLKLLGKEATMDRMQRMGKGISLVRHGLRDAEGGSKESVAEFKIEDINELHYISPWPASLDYSQNNAIEFHLEPLYQNGSSGGQDWAGLVRVAVHHAKPVKTSYGRKPEDAPPPPNPVEQQRYRELGPVFRDMLKGLQLRLTFQGYCPLVRKQGSPPMRNWRAGTASVDLINFSSENLDGLGGAFLGNEEIMLEMSRWTFDGENLAKHVQDYENNETVPVFQVFPHASRGLGSTALYVPPSRPLFDRFFQGKTLNYRPWAKPPETGPAEFDKIGWKGPAEKTKPEK